MAQCVHAAGESSPGDIQEGTYAVCLGVNSEDELLSLIPKLDAAGVAYKLIRESDPPYNGQATAIGIVPTTDRKMLKPILGNLKLYGR